jgi:glycine cleavage system regulatory protein
MPGGGYVEVELEIPGAETNEDADRMLHGRIIMERRADPGRRHGHQAPVVAELTGDDRDELTAELFRLARDNSALARSLMQLRSARQHAD